jgi:hypothetical protein
MSVSKKSTKTDNNQLKIDFSNNTDNAQKKEVKVISFHYRDPIYKDILNRTMKS